MNCLGPPTTKRSSIWRLIWPEQQRNAKKQNRPQPTLDQFRALPDSKSQKLSAFDNLAQHAPPAAAPPSQELLRLQAIEEAKSRFLNAASDADTVRASRELRCYVRDADNRTLWPLVDVSCRTEGLSVVSPVVFRERIRLLQLLVSSHCPVQTTVLSEPLYTAVIAFIRAAIQDGRQGLEDKAALAEVAGDVAANLAAQEGAPLVGDPARNQLLRVCFDGLAAPTSGSCHVQQSAAAALSQILPFTTSLTTPLVKALLRYLNSPSFPAKAVLIRAIASFASDGPLQIEGLVATDPESVAPYLMHIVGYPRSHLPASGLVAAMSSGAIEVRWAAVEAMRAVVVQFGPRVDCAQATLEWQDRNRPSNRAMVALQKRLRDKSRTVRDAADAAYSVLLDLQRYLSSTFMDSSSWEEYIEAREEARWSGPRSNFPFELEASPFYTPSLTATEDATPAYSMTSGRSTVTPFGSVQDGSHPGTPQQQSPAKSYTGSPRRSMVNMWLHAPQAASHSPTRSSPTSNTDFDSRPASRVHSLSSSPQQLISRSDTHTSPASAADTACQSAAASNADDSAFEPSSLQQRVRKSWNTSAMSDLISKFQKDGNTVKQPLGHKPAGAKGQAGPQPYTGRTFLNPIVNRAGRASLPLPQKAPTTTAKRASQRSNSLTSRTSMQSSKQHSFTLPGSQTPVSQGDSLKEELQAAAAVAATAMKRSMLAQPHFSARSELAPHKNPAVQPGDVFRVPPEKQAAMENIQSVAPPPSSTDDPREAAWKLWSANPSSLHSTLQQTFLAGYDAALAHSRKLGGANALVGAAG